MIWVWNNKQKNKCITEIPLQRKRILIFSHYNTSEQISLTWFLEKITAGPKFMKKNVVFLKTLNICHISQLKPDFHFGLRLELDDMRLYWIWMKDFKGSSFCFVSLFPDVDRVVFYLCLVVTLHTYNCGSDRHHNNNLSFLCLCLSWVCCLLSWVLPPSRNQSTILLCEWVGTKVWRVKSSASCGHL